MVAQDHIAVVAEVINQAFTLLEVEGDALIVVIGDPVVKPHGMLGNRQQPATHGRNRHTGF